MRSHGVCRGRDRSGTIDKIEMLIFFLVPFHYLDGYQGNVDDFAVM
jgi:hypothetical protein